MTSRALTSVLLAATFASSAIAAPIGFTGPFAGANFTVANSGTLIGGSPSLGTAVFTSSQLSLAGGNSISPDPLNNGVGCLGSSYSVLGPCQVTAVVPFSGLVSFNWAYTTAEADGPAGDIFGVIVDGTRTVLSDLGGALAQSGNRSFNVRSSFGWFVNCTDCINGRATAVISGVNVVPEPSTLALLLASGLAGWVGVQRRKPAAAG